MKPLNINLATFEYVDKRIAYSMIILLLCLVLLASGCNMIFWSKYNAQAAEFGTKLLKLQEKEKKILAARKLREEEMKKHRQSTRKHTLFVNMLIAKDIFPWDRILRAFELKTPQGLYIESFEHDDSFNKIFLKGYSKDMGGVTGYVKGIKEDEKKLEEDYEIFKKIDVDIKRVQDDKDIALKDMGFLFRFEIESSIDLKKLFPEKKFGGLWKIIAYARPGKGEK